MRRARPEQREPSRWLPLLCCLTVAGVFSPTIAAEAQDPSAVELIKGLLSGKASVGGPFELTDHNGRRRTDTDFRGKLVVLYFGYARRALHRW